MKKSISLILLLAALMMLLVPGVAFAAAGDFVPDPGIQTAYSKEFLSKCESQQWFINEVERLLNAQGKTLNKVTAASDFKDITSLGFYNKGVTGNIPAAIGELTNLQHLFMGKNNLSGTIPDSLFLLNKLKTVDLGSNKYTGAIPSGFGTMAALTELNLESNGYTGTIPASILANTTIQFLNLMNNKLTGGVPSDVNNMTGLTYLNLSQNNLGGPIPVLDKLSHLISLSLWSCNLSGEIPASIYTLATLQILDLDSNNFTGELSSDLLKLTSLQYLALSSNKLRGTLPDVFPASLQEIHLENNFLRGTVPNSLKTKADTGTKVYLQNNYLTGDTLKNMANNEKNFTDGAATEQYQLTASQTTVQIIKTGDGTNVYTLLRNQSKTTGNTTQKVLLNPDEYEIIYDNTKLEVTVTPAGIFVKALGDIPLADKLTIEIRIKDNTGSDYSRVILTVTTDTVSGGGGGGGGEVEPPPPPVDIHKPYILGYPDGSFRPEGNITREEVVTMVIRALEIDPSAYSLSSYSDVKTTRWSHVYIEEANARSYVNGYPDGTFRPANPISRAEFTALLVRIAKQQGRAEDKAPLTFPDVKSGAWYYNEVMTAARMGLTTGYPDGSFRPESPITRAEAVTMMNRFLGRDPNCDAVKTLVCPFPDVRTTHWAYGQVLEASVEHETNAIKN